MGRHSQEEIPEDRHKYLCAQLNTIGWGTQPEESVEGPYTKIYSRLPNPIGVMKELPDARTSRLKPKDFKAALQDIDMSNVHIHKRVKIGMPHWVETFSLEALEAVAYRLGQLQPEPDTGLHFSVVEPEIGTE